MAFFSATPLLALIFLAYNAVVFIGSAATLDGEVFSVGLMSGTTWTMTVADLLVIGGLLLLYVEIFKATRTSVSSVVNHTLSMLVFVAFIVEFITVEQAGTSTFLILGLMAMMDVVAGFTVTIVAARRDFAVGDAPNL